jgi:hypothetical protein
VISSTPIHVSATTPLSFTVHPITNSTIQCTFWSLITCTRVSSSHSYLVGMGVVSRYAPLFMVYPPFLTAIFQPSTLTTIVLTPLTTLCLCYLVILCMFHCTTFTFTSSFPCFNHPSVPNILPLADVLTTRSGPPFSIH